MDDVPDGRQAVWALLGLVVAAAIGFALYTYVGTLLFAIFLYYAIRPVHRRLERWFGFPDVAAAVTILLVVVPLVAIVAYAGLRALRELDAVLAAQELGTYRSAIEPYLELAREGDLGRLREAIASETDGSLATALRQGLPGAFGRLSDVAGFVLGVLVRLFLLLVLLFYLLRDDQRLRRWFEESVDDEELVAFLDRVDADLQTIFVANLAIVGVAAAMATVTYLGLNLVVEGQVVGTPVLLALLVGIGTLIPAVGMKIVYLPYGLYLLALGAATPMPLWQPVAFLVLSFAIVDTIPDFFARALLSARSGVHMGLVLLGYVLGSLAFGWYGLFLGPIVVVVAVHFAHEEFPDLAQTLLTE